MKEYPPTEKDIVKLGIDMCRALEVCGKYNIIHRDIKPSNIFISDVGDYKLGDFGVARTMEKTTGVLSKKGTVTYMSPEVYKGESYGATVDIYSLGIVLYRLMNNNLEPFRTDRTFADAESANFKRMSGAKMPTSASANEELSTMTSRLYNAADDLIPDKYGYTTHGLKFAGPVEPYGNLWLYTRSPFAYANICQSVSIDEMTIEYMDGTVASGNYGYAATWKR